MRIFKIYRDLWKFLHECRFYFLFITILFFSSLIFGYLFPIFFVDFIRNFIQGIVKMTEGLNFVQLLLFILQNNIVTAFIGMLLGVALGIVPLILVFFNGYVLGFVMNMAVGLSGAGILLRLLPHGIFELPALIISLGLGLKLGVFVFEKKKTKKKFLFLIRNSFKVFLFIVIPLLIIAAFIEAWLIVFLG